MIIIKIKNIYHWTFVPRPRRHIARQLVTVSLEYMIDARKIIIIIIIITKYTLLAGPVG